MLRNFKIDQLLVFFLLSIVFLLLSFGKELGFGKRNVHAGLVNYFEIENVLNVPPQGFINSNSTVSVFNPSLELWYSVNGGQDFILSNDELVIDEIENPDLTRIPTSYHWRQPKENYQDCRSLVVQLKNKSTGAITEKKVLTFLENQNSQLPTIALTLPQNDLFSEDRGVMAFGKSAYTDEGFYNSWWNRSGNFKGRGFEWEREVFFQYFEEGQLEFEQTCGMRISGNATRGFPQKSMQIVARKMYGLDRFEFPFFGESGQKKYTSLVIRNSGNDNTKTLFADLLMHWFGKETSVLTLKGTPTVVYLNGNYWGIYNLRERIDPYFISKVEDVSEDEVTILEGGNAELKDGSESVKNEFDALISKIENVEVLDQELYDEVCQSIHENSFVDYIFFETFYGNNDWPSNNSIWYKVENGKWKWILQDLDYGLSYLGAQNVNTNLFDKLKNSNTIVGILFNKLMTNETFKKIFIETCLQRVEVLFSDHNIERHFIEMKSMYQTEIEKHIGRWRMIDSIEEWEVNCKNNFDFLIDRKEIYLKQVREL